MVVDAPVVATGMNPSGAVVVRELEGLRSDIRRLIRATEGQSDEVFYLPYLTTQRLGLATILLNCNTPGVWAFSIGGSNLWAFETLAGTDTLEIPFPRVINPGQRITIVNTATGAEATIGLGLDFHSAFVIGSSLPRDLPNPDEGNLVDG